jgi:DNA primase
MKKEGWDFGEALRSLAQRAGVQLEKFRAQKPEEKEEHERLRALLEEAALFFRHQLVNTEEGKPALAYLREKRKLSAATMETFGLGYAPRGWDNAIKHLTGRGFTDKELIDAGIVSVREENRDTGAQEHRRAFDRFRERIMIPIRDANGKMAGFGARILRPDDFPKFLNSPETPLFSKSRLLYGMDRARKAIRATDQAVIVEGYLDVIAVHQAGFENVVSPMGTALTEDQLRLIKRFTRNIVLALDPDAAGKMAVLHGLETARQSLGGKVPVFDEGGDRYADAPSLLRFADRLQADLKVVALPDGLDPDELVERNRDEWVELVKSAKPIVLHVMQTLIAQHGLDTPKEKAKIVDEMVPFISGISDPVERDDYRQKLARLLKVDERSLLVEMHASGARKTRPRPRVEAPAPAVEAPAKAAPVPGSASYRIEAHILGILLRRPDLLYRFDRLLQEASLSRLTPEDFGYTDHQVFFRLARQSLEQVVSQYPSARAADTARKMLTLFK